MRIYYRPYRSPWGVSFGGIWGLLWLPAVLGGWLLWAITVGFWRLSGKIVPAERVELRVLLTVGMWGAVVWFGSTVPQTPIVSHSEDVSTALAAWTRDDPHCRVGTEPQYTDSITFKACTPPGMRTGYFHGVLVNDPNCEGGGYDSNTLGDVPCTGPPGVAGNDQTAGRPVRSHGQTLWYAGDPHCDRGDYEDSITVEQCTPPGMRAGDIGGVLVNDPGCLGAPVNTDPNANRRCTSPPGE